MTVEQAPEAPVMIEPRIADVSFTGKRTELFGLILRGFLLFVPTLGIYRFWLVTHKRRFYWSHTELDGDPLEYTGTARQLLIGFLIAVIVFLPLYAAFFYLSTQAVDIVLIGYAVIIIFFHFLTGYALYRARRFRLTRTLWRGIRFHQSGSALGYAWKRFLWSLLVLITAGLAYPFMVASLARHRLNHTQYGDRVFSSTASWRAIALPFYLTYFSSAVLVVLIIDNGESGNNGVAALLSFLTLVIVYLGFVTIQSREVSRFLSSVAVGEATLNVRVRARSLIWMHCVFAFFLACVGLLISIGVGIAIAVLGFGENLAAFDGEMPDLAALRNIGIVNLLALIAGYLGILAAWNILSELILGLGYWKLVARGTKIRNAEDLRGVHAAPGDESPLMGEGLADALNVGAY